VLKGSFENFMFFIFTIHIRWDSEGLKGRFRPVPAPVLAGLKEHPGQDFFNFQKIKIKIPKMKNKD